MKKFLTIAAASVFVFIAGNVEAQQAHICGNEVIQQETINNDPVLKIRMDNFYENYAAENKQLSEEKARAQNKTTADYENILIPVVFHIVLNQSQIDQMGGTQGILDRINTQLDVVNEDFSGKNADISGVPAAFQSLVGKANITFALAKRDAQGKAKLGIVYKMKDANFTGFVTQDNSVKRDVQGGSTPWDHTKYLNIWITNILPSQGQGAGQVLGYGYNADYALNVNGDAALAGVVIHYLTLGRRTGIGQNFYNSSTDKGRTLTHELGHYFNLWHIWGAAASSSSTDCFDDDGIDDTPLQAGANVSCPLGVKANCSNRPHPGGEMYMNFMDYSTDACTKMFSKGQVDRIRIETAPGGKTHTVTLNPQLAFWPSDVTAVEFNNKVDIAPNPSTGYFNIMFIEKYDELKAITITNAIGQVAKNIDVTDQQKSNYNVDISGLSKGMYIVQMSFETGVISRKLVVQ